MKFLKKWVLNIGNKVLIFLCSTMFQYIWSITNFTQIYSFSFLLKMTFRCLKWQFCCLYNTHHEKMTHSGEKSGGCFHSSRTSTCLVIGGKGWRKNLEEKVAKGTVCCFKNMNILKFKNLKFWSKKHHISSVLFAIRCLHKQSVTILLAPVKKKY